MSHRGCVRTLRDRPGSLRGSMEVIAICPDTPTITTIVNFYSLPLLQTRLRYVTLQLLRCYIAPCPPSPLLHICTVSVSRQSDD